MERNEWIINYLKGKEVKKVDLIDFFTIENHENDIEVIEKGTYNCTYITDSYIYDVTLLPLKTYTTTFTVGAVLVKERV